MGKSSFAAVAGATVLEVSTLVPYDLGSKSMLSRRKMDEERQACVARTGTARVSEAGQRATGRDPGK